MANHECSIGLYHHLDSVEMISLNGLKKRIVETREHNEAVLKGRWIDAAFLQRKEYTLRDYGDKRKSANLHRFNYCPECGKKVDWAKIRRMDDE